MDKIEKTSIGENFVREHRRRRSWKKVIAVLSCFVVIGTLGALTLPATTMSYSGCQLEEHTHGDECYKEVKTLVCDSESLGIHQHSDSCFDGDGNVICHYADFVLHTHDGNCYDADGKLICTLPEIEEHKHDENCFVPGEPVLADPGHQHTSECYEEIGRELLCTKQESEGHTHDETCCSTTKVLTCQEVEEVGHTHDDSCLDAEGKLICEQEEKAGHQHGENCYTEQETLNCGQEENEGYKHTDECYKIIRGEELICGQEERNPVFEDGEPILVCDKPEIHAHTHKWGTGDYGCYMDGGSREWHCDELEVRAHQHTEECFQTEKVLACEKEEHTHDESCKADTELTEEEIQQVNIVVSIIEGLPPVEEIEEEFSNLADDPEELAAYREKIVGAVQTAFDEYDALTDAQKEAVTNAEKLEAYRYLLEDRQVAEMIGKIALLPTIEEIDAKCAELAEDAEALAAYQEEILTSVQEVSDAYDRLTDAQKAKVENAEMLEAYAKWLNDHEITIEREYEVKQYADDTYLEVLDSPIAIAIHGRLPFGATVRSYPVEFNMGEDARVLCAQDITITLRDGAVYQPKEPVTVTVSGLEIPDHQELDVFHDLKDEYGGMERMEYTIDGDSVTFQASSFSIYAIVDAYELNRIAEPGDPEAMQALIDSGFFTYWQDKLDDEDVVTYDLMDEAMLAVEGGNGKPSDEQVTNRGGSNTDGTVTVSKTIQGTDVENVFDITLKVDTTTNITEILQEPDMAVVIVMDISNTMNDDFGGGTRYSEAVLAAEAFMDKFAANNKGYSKLGYVAFNTSAHEIFGLSKCTTNEVAGLKNTLRTQTGNIINNYTKDAEGNTDDIRRFTNIEGGLKRANDMLARASNKNKYIIFLSDGFPTTYCKANSYEGYNPYTSSGTIGQDGVFHDDVRGYYCSYGTSYSDKAAIKARNMATTIKNGGTTIFSIGVDVGGQTIDGYDHRSGLSVIDRTSTNYELGSATDTNAFKNWLGNSIGSGSDYYYDSTDTEGLKAAYDAIFEQIKSTTEQANNLKWIASDPMPVGTGAANNEVTMEFIGFFDKDKTLQVYPPQTGLTGSGNENAENTASFNTEKSAISWDIKNSGYTKTGSGNSTTYHYTVTYRVRLKNELEGFVENKSYQTNGKTTLTYQEVTVVDGKETISGDKTIDFPIPAVKGYLGELTFKKVNDAKEPLQDAEFELTHDDENCAKCRGDNQDIVGTMKGKSYTATSGTDGIVTFSGLPSGHDYVLKETKAPAGYQLSPATYAVKIAYDKVTVQENGENTTPWNFANGTPEVVNQPGVELPATGGPGTFLYIFSGTVLFVTAALMYSTCKRKKRKEAR